jgi:hypothetical protein
LVRHAKPAPLAKTRYNTAQEGNHMNEASAWRRDLGRQIGRAYAANPNVAAVMIAGSTGRGTADRYSDLELDIYWHAPPTEAERRAAATAAGGTAIALAEDPDEWEEQMDLGGFHAATSAFLVSTMERYLHTVLEDYSTDPAAQMRLYSVLHAQPLTGGDLIAGWQARAAAYPPPLAEAMLRENLDFDGFGYAEEMFAARDDVLVLYDSFCRIGRQILGALLGLNHIYLPNPTFKSMNELIDEMRVTPPDLAARLRGAFRVPPPDGVRELHRLCAEVFTLVELHVPTLDLAPYRAQLARRRGAWDAPPPL